LKVAPGTTTLDVVSPPPITSTSIAVSEAFGSVISTIKEVAVLEVGKSTKVGATNVWAKTPNPENIIERIKKIFLMI
jgi:hypothetical protein